MSLLRAGLAVSLLAATTAQPYPWDSRNVSAGQWACGDPPSVNTSLLPLTFADGSAPSCGTEVLQNVTSGGGVPTVTLPASLSMLGSTNFTLIAVDRDARSASSPTLSPLRHWAVGGLNTSTLAAGYNAGVAAPGAVVYFNYSGPQPPAGTGCHRYYVVLYAQPAGAPPPALAVNASNPADRWNWDFPAWATANGLQRVALNYWSTQSLSNRTGPCSSATPTTTPTTTATPSAARAGAAASWATILAAAAAVMASALV